MPSEFLETSWEKDHISNSFQKTYSTGKEVKNKTSEIPFCRQRRGEAKMFTSAPIPLTYTPLPSSPEVHREKGKFVFSTFPVWSCHYQVSPRTWILRFLGICQPFPKRDRAGRPRQWDQTLQSTANILAKNRWCWGNLLPKFLQCSFNQHKLIKGEVPAGYSKFWCYRNDPEEKWTVFIILERLWSTEYFSNPHKGLCLCGQHILKWMEVMMSENGKGKRHFLASGA